MITKAHITRRAAQDNVPAITVERDYVLAHVIAGFATLGVDTGLVFKGGTALRLCHIDDYRNSVSRQLVCPTGQVNCRRTGPPGLEPGTKGFTALGAIDNNLHISSLGCLYKVLYGLQPAHFLSAILGPIIFGIWHLHRVR